MRFEIDIVLTTYNVLGREIHYAAASQVSYISLWYYNGPVWCDPASQQYTQYEKTSTRVWCKAYEDNMKTTPSSDSVLSRVIVDLSMYPKKKKKLASLNIRPWYKGAKLKICVDPSMHLSSRCQSLFIDSLITNHKLIFITLL